MRCLTPADVENLFGKIGFSVAMAHASYGPALRLDGRVDATQIRLSARPPAEPGQLIFFGRALNRWLPTGRSRLLWVDHWESGTYGADDAVIMAARNGLGEARPLKAAPGHYFDAHPYDEEDQSEVSPEQSRDMALLSGLMSLIMTTQSDAWLIADGCTDRIEFWEGNLYFHSHDPSQLEAASSLLDTFDCSRTPK